MLIIVLPMIDAVLVEFEGVIAETRAARREALLDSLRDDGIALSDSEYLECCESMPVRASVRAALALRDGTPDETAIELAAVRAERRFSSRVLTGLSLADGARAFVESLQSRTRLGIVTRASRTDVDTMLALSGLEHAFEFVIADDDAYRPKPSPDQYLGALDRLGRLRAVVPKNVVALEDGLAGIRAAKSAGLRCAAVGSLPVHQAVDADALVPSLAALTIASLDAVTLGKQSAGR